MIVEYKRNAQVLGHIKICEYELYNKDKGWIHKNGLVG